MLESLFTVLNFLANVGIIVLIIGVLVFVHELGHFLAARATGMLVEEFAIGFGPKLFSFKRGDTEYMIKLLPLGGYVKILGEAGEEQEWLEEIAEDKKNDKKGKEKEKLVELTKEELEDLEMAKSDPRSFLNKSKKARFFVMIAGVTMNYFLAVICFYIWLAGNNYEVQLPVNMIDFKPTFAEKVLTRTGDITYEKLVIDSPAAKSGMPEKGSIKSLNGESIDLSYELRERISKSINSVVTLNVCDESNVCKDYNVEIASDGKAGIYLGVNYTLKLVYAGNARYASGFANSIDNLNLMGYVISGMFKTAKETGNYQDVAVNSFSSPIALYFVVDAFKEYGMVAILRLVGEFSFSLALINVLPIPALDGGRILLLGIEALRGKPMNRKLENTIIAISFYALMFLMLAIVLKDIIFINVIRGMF